MIFRLLVMVVKLTKMFIILLPLDLIDYELEIAATTFSGEDYNSPLKPLLDT